MGVIYRIVNTMNGKIYIGSTNNFEKRTRKHLLDLRKGKHHSQHLQRAFSKYGESAFEFEVMEDVFGNSLLAREQEYLDKIRPFDPSIGYNISEKATNCVLRGEKHWTHGLPTEEHHWYGKRHSEETKQRIGDAQRGKLNHMFGKPGPNRGRKASDETRRRISASKKGIPGHWKGKKHRPESIEKMRKAAIGRKASDKVVNKTPEWCMNISRAKKGKNTGGQNPNSKRVLKLTKDGQFVREFSSLSEAAKDTGVTVSCITACCQKRVKTSGGYIWRYAMKE